MLSSAVCAINGVCMLDSTVPLSLRNRYSVGICSRSDGTLGLSRKKCTLSKVMLMTCFTPFPSLQDPAAEDPAAPTAAGTPADAGAAPVCALAVPAETPNAAPSAPTV